MRSVRISSISAALAAGAVATPVREQVGREAGVADESAVGAAVAQAEDRRRVQDHLPDGFVVVVDEDIDPTNLFEVLWAMCTRCDPTEDIDIVRK